MAKRLFIDWFTSLVHENYKLRISWDHVVYINCSECQNKKQFVYTTCSLPYCGLVDARISASEKDLPVKVDNSQAVFPCF